jgi:hypothetical protein
MTTKKARFAGLFALLLAFLPLGHALAQSTSPIVLPNGCGTGNPQNSLAYLTVDSTLKLCVNATVTVPPVTVGGFTPSLGYASLTASASSASSALPSNTGVVAFQNTGSATVSCTLGVGSATALANEIQVPASSTVFVTVGSNTFGACIDQTGSTSNLVVLAGGSGLGTGFGGGGGGGGSGGNVTIVGPLGQALAAASVPVILPAATITALTPPTSVGVNNFPATQPISAASGAIQPGAGLDGAFVTEGTKADAPATLPASTTAASGISLWKAIANALNSLLSAATTPLDNTSVPISISTSATTQLVALSGSTQVRITSFDVVAGGTGTFQLVYGTGTNCGTSQNPLTGAYPLTAQAGIAKGSGIGTILKAPAGQAVCAVTVGAVQYSGSLSEQQF